MSKDSMKKSQGPSFRLHGCSRPQWGITLWQEPQKEWSLSVLDRVNIWAKWERKLRGRNYHGLVVCILSCFSSVQLFATLWTVARQAPLSTGFSRQEYWSGLPFPSPGDLLTKGSNLHLLHLIHWRAGSLPLGPPGKPIMGCLGIFKMVWVEPELGTMWTRWGCMGRSKTSIAWPACAMTFGTLTQRKLLPVFRCYISNF